MARLAVAPPEELQSFRLLFSGNPLPMWVYDLETLRILDVNDSAAALYGYARAELLRKRVIDLCASADAAEETVRVRASRASFPFSAIRRYRRKDGTIMHVHMLARPLLFRTRRAVLMVAHDVTELSRAAEAAQGGMALLERLAELSETLARPLMLSDMIPVIGAAALALSDASKAALYLRHPDGTITGLWAEGLPDVLLGETAGDPRDLPGMVLSAPDANFLALPNGRIADGRRPFLCSDVEALPSDSIVRQRARRGGYAAVGIWPLPYDGRITAVISCHYDHPRIWTRDEEEAFSAFARHAAIALENGRLYDAHVRTSATVETFIALNRVLQAAQTVEEAYAVLAAQAMRVAGADHASLALLAADRQTLTLVHTAGIPLPWPEQAVSVANTRLGWVVRTGRAFVRPLGTEPSSPCADDDAYRGVGPLAILSVRADDRPMGALIVARPEGADSPPFTSADVRVLQGLADIAGPAIQWLDVIRRLQRAYAGTALALAQAVQAHGEEPGSRAARLVGLAAATAGALRCSVQDVEDVRWGALLYDIGMIMVPPEIARKPDSLSEQEWAVIRQHPVIGGEVLRSVAQLRRAALLVRHHQERWDGSGYPDRLRGEQIPLGARILAVVEAYAAMGEPRSYRPARTHDEMIAEIRGGAGTQFDPRVVEAFCDVLAQTGAQPAQPAVEDQRSAPRPPGAKRPGRSLDDKLRAALQALPDGARQLVHLLDIEEVELEVEEHLAQVGQWSIRLAAAAGVAPERQGLLAQAALLHDVGKLSLSRTLLRKPGVLSPEERALLVQHVTKGVVLLRALDVDEEVVGIVAAHHERWDGSGYPRGLAGEGIPLEARILAIADSFDAMTTERAYHRARTREEAVTELRREAGRQFDPRLIEVFIPLVHSAG